MSSTTAHVVIVTGFVRSSPLAVRSFKAYAPTGSESGKKVVPGRSKLLTRNNLSCPENGYTRRVKQVAFQPEIRMRIGQADLDEKVLTSPKRFVKVEQNSAQRRPADIHTENQVIFSNRRKRFR